MWSPTSEQGGEGFALPCTWTKSYLARPFTMPITQQAGTTPEAELEQRQLLAMGDDILRGMSDKARRAFVLFEIEGCSGEEIAELEGIPLATVWTRVHNARKEFTTRAEKRRQKEDLR